MVLKTNRSSKITRTTHLGIEGSGTPVCGKMQSKLQVANSTNIVQSVFSADIQNLSEENYHGIENGSDTH